MSERTLLLKQPRKKKGGGGEGVHERKEEGESREEVKIFIVSFTGQ